MGTRKRRSWRRRDSLLWAWAEGETNARTGLWRWSRKEGGEGYAKVAREGLF